MTPIDSSRIALVPAVLERWKLTCRQTAAQLHAAGITDVSPGEEQFYQLADGRLLLSAEIRPGMSVNIHVERNEWVLVENN